MSAMKTAREELEDLLRDWHMDDGDIDTVFDAIDELEWREPAVAIGPGIISRVEWVDDELDRVEIDIPRTELPRNLFKARFRLQEIEDE